jgi:hypothetical protein
MLQGSLDAPPIVIVGSRRQTVLLLLGAALLGFFGYQQLHDPSSDAYDRTIGWVGMVLFTLAGGSCVLKLLAPARLELAPAGFTTWTLFGRKVHRSWANVSPFALGPYQLVLFDEVADTSILAHFNRLLMGYGRGIGGGWDLTAEELAKVLNDARDQWI